MKSLKVVIMMNFFLAKILNYIKKRGPYLMSASPVLMVSEQNGWSTDMVSF